MALREAYVALRATGLEKVLFLLDASESARAYQAAIIALVRDVLSALPVTAVPALYFLGNSTAYTPRHFASRAVQWFQENQQRASLVTPVLETLKSHEPCTARFAHFRRQIRDLISGGQKRGDFGQN